MIGRDAEVEAAVAVLRQAGRRVGRRRHSALWTVGLAAYDRRQLIAAAIRIGAPVDLDPIEPAPVLPLAVRNLS